MPDAIYLYTTGQWKDHTRKERIGSEALDYVGKCFNDGSYPACCLLVKFATKKEQYDDNKKWYVYPDITDEYDIWSILNFTFCKKRSVGKGYHNKVHPFLTSTKYEHISPPSLRIYTAINYWRYRNGEWIGEEGDSTYIRNRPFNDLKITSIPYTHTQTPPTGYCLRLGYYYSFINTYDMPTYTPYYDSMKRSGIEYILLQNESHIKTSTLVQWNWYPFLDSYYGFKKVNITGFLYNSSVVITYIFQQKEPQFDPLNKKIDALQLTPKMSA